MNVNWCVRLAVLLVASLMECGSQGTERCIAIDNVSRLTATAVEVSWNITFTPEEGEQYRVIYRIRDNMLDQLSVPVNAASTEPFETYRLYIGRLDSTAEYCFQVQVVGTAPQNCSEIQCLAPPGQEIPTEIPSDFMAEPGSDQVRFSWSVDQSVQVVSLSCHTTPENLVLFSALLSAATSPSVQEELTGAHFMPFTDYSCDISIVVSAGVAGPGSTVTFQTLQDVPDTPPTDVVVEAVSPYQVTVTWSPPATPNGIITQYRLSATLNESPLSSIFVPGDVLSREIDGLTPFGIFTVAISASTFVGQGPFSPTTTIRTQETPPSAVTDLLVSALSDTSLIISWSPPEQPNGILTRYAYTVSDNPAIPGPEQTTAANDSQTQYLVRVDSLNPFVEYRVEVYAVNSAGNGAPQSSTVYTRESVPSAPEITSFVRRSSNSMQVDWNAQNQGGFITHYTIEYEPLYVSTVDCRRQSENVAAVSQNSNSVTIYGLEPIYSYSVSVIAHNSVGMSPRSVPATVEPIVSEDTGYSNGARSSFVQLRLSGVENCTTWIEENASLDLVSEIAVRLSVICPNCEYTNVNWLTESSLQCTGRNDQVLFRAVLSAAACSNPALSCKEHLEFWASLQDPFLILGEQILLVDSTCSLYTNSSTSNECIEVEGTSPTCTPSTDSRGGIIAASFLGGVLAGFALSLILIIATCAYFLRKPKGSDTAKSSDDVEYDNPMRTYRKAAVQEDPDAGYEPLPLQGYTGGKASDSISKQSHQSNKKKGHQQKSPGQSTVSTSVPYYDGLTASSSGHYHAKGHFVDHSPASWMWSNVPEDPEAEHQAASQYDDDNSPYEFPSTCTLPNPPQGKAVKKPGSRDTGSEAESEKVSKRVKELRSASTVQKEPTIQEASSTSEQKKPPKKKKPLLPPDKGGKQQAQPQRQPQPVSKSKRVRDGDKMRGPSPAIQPKPKGKATGSMTLQYNEAYEKVTPMGSTGSSLSSSGANI